MFFTLDRVSVSKRLASAVTALTFFAASTEVSHAYGIDTSNRLQHGAAVSGGSAAMLRLRIPFGGESTTASQAMFGLSFGSTWRDAPGVPNPVGYRFVPRAELGMTLNGDPILRLGSFDITPNDANLDVTEAQGESSFCGRNLALCIIGGVVIVGVVIFVVAARNSPSTAPF